MKARCSAALLFALAPALAGCPEFHAGPMPNEPKNATYASVDGVRLRFVDRGAGPAVVMVHGFASSLDTWDDVLPELAERHRVIALDLKGFGWSDRPEGDYSPAAEAKLVLDLLKQRGVDRFAIVAHSWGSSVALALALEAKERVTRLALYDAWVYEEQLPTMFVMARADGIGEALFATFYSERADEKMEAAFYDKKKLTEPLAEAVERAMERPGTTAAALAAVRGQRFTALQQRYKDVRQPALLLWGREDAVTRLPFGERLAAELPHAKLVVYPRCGHFPMIEAKNASNAELVRFLDEDLAGGGAGKAAARPAEERPAKDVAPQQPPSQERDNAQPPQGKP